MNVAPLHAPATPRDVLHIIAYEHDAQMHTHVLPPNRMNVENRIRSILTTVARIPAGLPIRREAERVIREVFDEGRDIFPEDLLEQSDQHRMFLLHTLAKRLRALLERAVS